MFIYLCIVYRFPNRVFGTCAVYRISSKKLSTKEIYFSNLFRFFPFLYLLSIIDNATFEYRLNFEWKSLRTDWLQCTHKYIFSLQNCMWCFFGAHAYDDTHAYSSRTVFLFRSNINILRFGNHAPVPSTDPINGGRFFNSSQRWIRQLLGTALWKSDFEWSLRVPTKKFFSASLWF